MRVDQLMSMLIGGHHWLMLIHLLCDWIPNRRYHEGVAIMKGPFFILLVSIWSGYNFCLSLTNFLSPIVYIGKCRTNKWGTNINYNWIFWLGLETRSERNPGINPFPLAVIMLVMLNPYPHYLSTVFGLETLLQLCHLSCKQRVNSNVTFKPKKDWQVSD